LFLRLVNHAAKFSKNCKDSKSVLTFYQASAVVELLAIL
jgi:hypothetical protein